jgi:hypothetical protein
MKNYSFVNFHIAFLIVLNFKFKILCQFIKAMKLVTNRSFNSFQSNQNSSFKNKKFTYFKTVELESRITKYQLTSLLLSFDTTVTNIP